MWGSEVTFKICNKTTKPGSKQYFCLDFEKMKDKETWCKLKLTTFLNFFPLQ